jgi:hypothetical protein
MNELSLSDLANAYRWNQLPQSQNIEDRRGLPSGSIDPLEARRQQSPFEMPLRETPWDADIMRQPASAPQMPRPPDMNLAALEQMLQQRFQLSPNDPLAGMLR